MQIKLQCHCSWHLNHNLTHIHYLFSSALATAQVTWQQQTLNVKSPQRLLKYIECIQAYS